jgi:hypothetical protein
VDDPLEEFVHRAIGHTDRERLDAAAMAVMGALHTAGVGALLLKGPVSARWLYEPHEVRGYTDCDVLAAPDRFASAGRAMREAGFHLHVDEATHPEVREEGRSQVWHRLPQDVWVDLQWRLPGFTAPPGEVWERLWAERETMEIGVGRVPVASEPARALHLATAAAAGATKALIDLERAVVRLPFSIWEAAFELADGFRARTDLVAGLALADGGAELGARFRSAGSGTGCGSGSG